jgi:O-antigen ligase
LFIYIACGVILYSLALSGGRTGYATWAAIGALFAFFKWRRFLFYGPIVALIIISLVPAARDRFLMGFSEDTVDERNTALVEEGLVNEDSNVDLYTVTSGRTVAWPFVIEKIKESPITGYGKEAMIRSGLSSYLWLTFQEGFPHPHNMYLQWIFDNGLIGMIPVLIFYLLILKYSFSLFRDTRSPVFVFVGGASLSLILALFIAGFGSQTFYPREGSVAMWCIIGLMLRVYILRRQAVENLDKKESDNSISVESLWTSNSKKATDQPLLRPNFYR